MRRTSIGQDERHPDPRREEAARGPIRVAVVDDHPATAEGLAALLAAEPDIVVVGTAAEVAGARALIDRQGPDVVLCDIELAGGARGFELLDPARPTGPAVILFSSYDYPAFHAHALERGAAGYLLKTAPIKDVLDAIRTVAGGGSAFTYRGLHAARTARRPPSDRELRVIELVAAGRPNIEIAERLGIGSKTVESHLRRLFARYGVDNRTELVAVAVGEGWVAPSGQRSRSVTT